MCTRRRFLPPSLGASAASRDQRLIAGAALASTRLLVVGLLLAGAARSGAAQAPLAAGVQLPASAASADSTEQDDATVAPLAAAHPVGLRREAAHSLTGMQRWEAYRGEVTGPRFLVRTALFAGLAQAQTRPTQWSGGFRGFGRRFLSAGGRTIVGASVASGTAALLHEDLRYEPSGASGFLPRVGSAFRGAVTARTESGSRVLALPRFAGIAAGAAAQSAWEPPRGVDARHVARTLLTSTAITAAFNLVREYRSPRSAP